jgi:maleate cis-trans isomerase
MKVENDLGVPVVHPVAARVWLVQKKLRVRNPIKGASRLLEEMP